MASVATSCAPCVFSASTTLLSFPYSVLQTFTVQVIPQITVRNGTSVTIGAKTTTIDEPVVANSPTGPGGPVIATFTDPSLLTWSTLGTVLTYPTTYVEYLGFDGASATSSGCAASITPTAIPLPSDVNSASLVYPSNDTTAGLPPGLLGYLDSLPGFTAQLGEPVASCATPGPVAAPSPTASTSQPSSTVGTASSSATSSPQASSTVASTSSATSGATSSASSNSTSIATTSSSPSPVSTSISTLTGSDTTTTLSPSTTITSTSYSTETSTLPGSSTIITSTPVLVSATIESPASTQPTTTSEATSASASSANPTAQTVTHSTAHIFSTITINPVISQSGTATTLSTTLAPPTALPVSAPSSATLNSAALGGFLSYINSLTASTTPSGSSMTTSSMTSSSMTTAAPYINGTGVSSTLVGPLTGTLSGTPYTVDNATSTTYAVLNGTSTTYVVPYTGNAAPGGVKPVGLGWLECFVGLAIPVLL